MTYFSQAYEGKQKRRESELQLLLYVKPCSFAAANKQEAKKRNPANTAAKSKVEGGRIYLSFLRAGTGKGVSCGNIFEKIKKQRQ